MDVYAGAECHSSATRFNRMGSGRHNDIFVNSPARYPKLHKRHDLMGSRSKMYARPKIYVRESVSVAATVVINLRAAHLTVKRPSRIEPVT